MPLPVESEKELSVGGFQGIKKVRGLLVDIDVVDPPETWDNQERQVVVVKLEDATVLEMFGDEEPFELREGKFSFYVPYVAAGSKPHQNSVYSKCWLASAKELGKVPSELIGSYVTLEKQARLLFQKPVIDPSTKKAVTGKDGKKVLEDIVAVDQSGRPNHFCFVGDETTTSNGTETNEYIRDLIVGLNQKAALRKLLIDQKARQHPEYKTALNDGTLAELLELVVIDGKFQKLEEVESVATERLEDN